MSSLIASVFRMQVHHFLSTAITKGTLIINERPDPTTLNDDDDDNDNDNDNDNLSPKSVALQPVPDATLIFGEPPTDAVAAGRPVATLNLVDAASFYARVVTAADVGFSEAFIHGDFVVPPGKDVDSDDAMGDALVDVFRVLILNRDEAGLGSTSPTVLTRIGTAVNWVLHRCNRNTLSGSRRNIEAHYDLSNDLFATFLGETWVYSCALFGCDGAKAQPPAPLPGKGGDSDGRADGVDLDEAQRRKLAMIIGKLRIAGDGDGVRVLDIGCGWAELAIEVVRRHPKVRVTGITLSREQLTLGRQRVRDAGVATRGDGQVELRLVDYRDLAASGAQFDRVVSVEMIEAVGHEFLGVYFAAIDRLLARDGVAVVQAITTPNSRYETYRRRTDFIQKHIFPGACCPSVGAMSDAIARHTALDIEGVENIGTHYATTLREWRARFTAAARAGRVAKAGFDDAFVRKWVYYLSYCESGFATRTLGVLQMVLTRVNNVAAFGGPPAAARVRPARMAQ